MDFTRFSIDPISFGIGTVLGLLLVGLAMGRKNAALAARLGNEQDLRERLQGEFRLLAQDALKENQQQFLTLATEKLKAAHTDSAHDLEKRQTAISELLKPMQTHLETLGSAVEQIKGTDQVLKDEIKGLTRETAKLAGALRDPAAQGKWGEYILEGIMDNSGLIKGVHYVTQESLSGGTQRPDMIIQLHDGLKIVVDAKTPLNDFASALSGSMSETEADATMKNLAQQIRTHINTLSKKGYWENLDVESVDFTVLFLPSEPLFSMALRSDPGIVDLAASKNIVIASPTLMMALLRVVRMGWRQVDLASNARAISDQGAILYQRLVTFTEHLSKAGRGLSGALGSYNDAIGSLERMVLPAARKLQEMGVQDSGKSIPELKVIEDTPRRLTGTDGSV